MMVLILTMVMVINIVMIFCVQEKKIYDHYDNDNDENDLVCFRTNSQIYDDGDDDNNNDEFDGGADGDYDDYDDDGADDGFVCSG